MIRKAPAPDPAVFSLDIPLFGICYGMQLMAQELGGRVDKGQHREFGYAQIDVVDAVPLFGGLAERLQVWMSHGDQVGVLPAGFRATAKTGSCPIAAMADEANRRFGLQFHPEVVHTPQGAHLLRHFVFDVCGCKGDWKMSSFVEESIKAIREKGRN
jgi:GMP synthase (glutamine-hydrolysing)